MGNTAAGGGKVSLFGLTPEQEAQLGYNTGNPPPIPPPVNTLPTIPPGDMQKGPGIISGAVNAPPDPSLGIGGSTGGYSPAQPYVEPVKKPLEGGPVSEIIGKGTPTNAPASPILRGGGAIGNPNEVRPSWMIGNWKPEEANTKGLAFERMPEILKYNQGIVSNAVATPTPITPAATTPVTPTAPVTQPGYKAGETKEQRRARIEKNRRAKGEIA